MLFIDEAHATIPQIRAMYNGDAARKRSLVDYGFRLPAAFDNRPLKFHEFEQRVERSRSTSPPRPAPTRWSAPSRWWSRSSARPA